VQPSEVLSALDDPLMDVAALARYLAVNETFIRRLVHERRVPFHKLGKFVRFRRSEIDLWIERRLVDEYHR